MAVAPQRATSDLFRPHFEDFVGAPTARGNRLGNLMKVPPAEVVETKNEINVVLELPGLRPEDVDVDLENNVLTIRGEKRQETGDGGERGTWHLTERRYGQYSRSFVLPRDVEADRIAARLQDGILRVTIPKSERARPRRIEISSQNGKHRVDSKST